MKVTSTDSKNFTLFDNNEKLGTLVYPKWYSLTAEIHINDQEKYEIGPTGFWGTTIELRQDNDCKLKLKINWKGNAVIQMPDGSEGYELQQRGLLKSSFVLSDKDGKDLMVLRSDFQWTKFNYDFLIETTDALKALPHHLLLVFAAVHYTNYYISMTTAVVA